MASSEGDGTTSGDGIARGAAPNPLNQEVAEWSPARWILTWVRRKKALQAVEADGKSRMEDSIGRRGLVSGRSGFHIMPRIDRGVVHAHFIMNVGSGGATANPGVADDFATLDAGSGDDGVRGEMRIPGSDAKAVIDDNHATITGVLSRIEDHTVSGNVHGRTVVRADIHAGVERTFTREGIQAFAEAVRDAANHRHNGRCITRVRESAGRQQAEATCGDS